jgi:multiple sugar transport system ATP-binding protein
MKETARIVLENLTKNFGHVKAVDNVNLEIEDKEFVTLLGPSGCGKTTTLRMIAGLELPTSGRIYFDGKLVTDVPPHKRNVAMVFQDYALYPHMNAFENIAFSLRMRKVPNNEIREQVTNTARVLRIEHLLDRMPPELSGGEKQRVALGRALVRKPTASLLDEPLSSIDAKLRDEMRSELIKIHEKFPTTFVYVTHDQVEAMTLSNKIAVMQNGRIHQYDTPINLFYKPVNTFVASFIGSPAMNLIEGKLSSPQAGKVMFEGQDFAFPVPVEVDAEHLNAKAVLGVRPEGVVLHEKEVPGSFGAELYTAEIRGEFTVLKLKLGDTILTSRIESGRMFKKSMWVTFAKGYVFDANSQLKSTF